MSNNFVNRIIKFILKILLSLIFILILFISTIIIINTVKDYNPPQKENLKVYYRNNNYILCDTCVFSFLTWNIGYCGLGKEMDFFYEGGKKVMPSVKLYDKYKEGISNYLKNNSDIDFILLQEVDFFAKRSYKKNQFEHFSKILNNKYEGVFAINYNVPFIPLPLSNPMGQVKSGIVTFSKYKIDSVYRYSLPGSYYWPKKVFFLDRCIILSKYKLLNGKYLIIINLHNSAFNDAADIRLLEMNYLKNIMQMEYNKGNYVIAGGDWNLNPYSYSPKTIKQKYKAKIIEPALNNHFFETGWTYVYDSMVPTNRDVNTPYYNDYTKTTIIDFFVVSPNIKVLEIKADDKNFTYSDHNPVKMKVKLSF